MAKVNKKSEKITPFGGIYYARLFMRFHLTKSSIALYLRMRQMDKDCKKMVSELIHRHAV